MRIDQHNIYYNMSKIFLLLVGLIVIGSAAGGKDNGKLSVQMTTMFARLSQSDGEVTVPCKGGNGQYKYDYQNLPENM